MESCIERGKILLLLVLISHVYSGRRGGISLYVRLYYQLNTMHSMEIHWGGFSLTDPRFGFQRVCLPSEKWPGKFRKSSLIQTISRVDDIFSAYKDMWV